MPVSRKNYRVGPVGRFRVFTRYPLQGFPQEVFRLRGRGRLAPRQEVFPETPGRFLVLARLDLFTRVVQSALLELKPFLRAGNEGQKEGERQQRRQGGEDLPLSCPIFDPDPQEGPLLLSGLRLLRELFTNLAQGAMAL